jgi:hypothetical protein
LPKNAVAWINQIDPVKLQDSINGILFVTIRKIIRLSGKIAIVAAMAALLLQASCTIGLTAMATAESAIATHSGCHDSAPSTPDAPNSGQKCCNGKHSPEALLAATTVAPLPLASTKFVSSVNSVASPFLPHATEIAIPPSGPPGPLALRI